MSKHLTEQELIEMYMPGRKPGKATLKEKNQLEEFQNAIKDHPGKYKNFFAYYWSKQAGPWS